MVIECNGCQYCQTKFEHTKDERDLNRIALGLNRKVGK